MVIFISVLLFLLIILQGISLFIQIRKKDRFSMLHDIIVKNVEQLDRSIKEESRQGREELQKTLKMYNDSVLRSMSDISSVQNKQINQLTNSNELRIERMRETVEKRLELIQDDNSKKLEQMRATVDEKLHATLEKRLGESFKFVSERLELVHKGLGEMQALASGVGDLKRVLSNVKTRGVWGEMQLGNLLEEILTHDQYGRNVKTKQGSNDFVEFAIKLPGRSEDKEQVVWLPVDAKFPQDTYHRLIDAQEQADPGIIEDAAKQLEATIKAEAKNINEKYIDPPHTTDFGILFMPVEGLYAEVLRRPGLHGFLMQKYRVLIAGPTDFSALLNSLQMGFRTLAIEKRSSEVWSILSSVKTEFGKFGDILDKTQKKIQEASNTIDLASRRSRAIERQLRKVQELPESESQNLFPVVEES